MFRRVFCCLTLLVASMTPISGATTPDPNPDETLRSALAELDAVFDECFAWWGRVYDPVTGACFYALSGKVARDAGEPEFAPDIEATSKLVNVLDWSGILDRTDPAFRAGIVRFMQERQDAASGFFRDPTFASDYTANTLDRAVGMASGALRRCGGAPLYPLPVERIADNAEAAGHYAHLASSETLTVWLEQLPWERRLWTVGATLHAQSGIFRNVEEPRRSQLLATVATVVAARQAADGYFGLSKDSWISRLSGTYKIMGFLDANRVLLPNSAATLATLLGDLKQRDYDNLIVLYNTVNLLTILHRNGAALSSDQCLTILRRSTAIMARFQAPGGGFLTQLGKPAPEANGKVYGKPILEGNTNATGLAHKTRDLLYQLTAAGIEPPMHPRSGDLLTALQP